MLFAQKSCERAFYDLAGWRHRHFGDRHQSLGPFELGNALTLQPSAQPIEAQRRAGFEHDAAASALPQDWIGHRYDRALHDGLVAVNQRLNV